MQPADAVGTSLRPRFPALDPEPSRRRWHRVAPALAVVVVLMAAISFYAARRPGHHGGGAGESAHVSLFSGLILAQASSGVLSLTDVHTGRMVLLRKLGPLPTDPPPSVSPDGKYLVAPTMGTLLSLATPARPARVRNALTFPGNSNLMLADPFSDHDASMLIQGDQFPFQTAFSGYSVQSVQSGHTASLGVADSAAGDPRAPGAFVSHARPSRVTPPSGVYPDISVELRDAGAAPKVIATSAMVDHVLGITPRYGVTLVPYPNPQGTMVAVMVQPISGNQAGPISGNQTGGIVVYSRAGKMLGFQMGALSGLIGAVWSRSGTTLAFVGQGDNSAELTDWEIGGQSTTSEMQVSLRQLSECAWSPDGLSVLCGGRSAGAWWIVQSGMTYSVAGHGHVLAWLGGRLGRRLAG